jgi:broad specificity phosphatase PhoE
VLFIASPFSRTVETAERALAGLQEAAAAASSSGPSAATSAPLRASVTTSDSLRERYFGSYELQSHGAYEAVWARDSEDEGHRPEGGGESIRDVAERLRALLLELEATHRGKYMGEELSLPMRDSGW